MYISKIQIASYKSYHNAGEIQFSPGFNIVVGKNSAGKTALLEAIQLTFTPNSHRSLKTVPIEGSLPTLQSTVLLTFALTREELLRLLKNTHYHYATPAEYFTIPNFGRFTREPEPAKAFLK